MAVEDQTARAKPDKERAEFRRLLLENANYFGNLKDSPLKGVKKIVAQNAGWRRVVMGRVLSLTALAMLTAGLTGCCTPPKIGGVNANRFTPQHTNTWCWAASTELVSDYFSHRINQCDSSKYVHGKPADCSKGCSGYCNCFDVCGATIGQIKDNWNHWKFSYAYESSHLSWGALKKTLSSTSSCDKSPVQVIWWWTGGGGHVVSAYGYAETSVGNFVSYYNPWQPDCTTPDKSCASTSTNGGDDAVAPYDWIVSTADKQWGDTFHKFAYTGP